MQVKFGDAVSMEMTMEVGSPQGAVISPLVFALVFEVVITRVKDTINSLLVSKDPETHQPLLGARYTDPQTLQPHEKASFAGFADDSGAILVSRSDDNALRTASQRLVYSYDSAAEMLGIAVSTKSFFSVFELGQKSDRDDISLSVPSWGVDKKLVSNRTEAVRDLGVMLDPNMSFSTQHERACGIFNAVYSTMHRMKHLCSPYTLRAI